MDGTRWCVSVDGAPVDGSEWMQWSSDYESDYEDDLELTGLGDTQTRTQTYDGLDMTFSAQKDPFLFL